MRRAFLSSVLWAALAVVPAAAAQGNADWDSGVSHYNQKQYRQAIVDFQKVVEATPDFANTYYYLGLSHFYLKEYNRAIGDLNRYVDATEKAGKKPEGPARVALGRAYILLNDYEKAVTALSVATQTVTDDPTNFYYLAAAYQKLGQNDKAIEALNGGLKRFPKDGDMLDMSTRLLLERALKSKTPADFQAAITRGEQLRIARDDAASAELLGTAYLQSGDFTKASVHYARVVKDKADDGPSWFNYGLSLSRSKQFAKAAPALEKASTIVTDNAGLWAELGYVQFSLKDYTKALAAYEKSYAINPDPQVKETIDGLRPLVQ